MSATHEKKLDYFLIYLVAWNITSPQTTEFPLFAGSNVHMAGCNFHIYNGPVTIVQQNQQEGMGKSNKRRRLVIESDEDE